MEDDPQILKARYRDEFDAQVCLNCGEAHDLEFCGLRCHPGAGLFVRYPRGTGRLELHCMKCGVLGLVVQVARRRARKETKA